MALGNQLPKAMIRKEFPQFAAEDKLVEVAHHYDLVALQPPSIELGTEVVKEGLPGARELIV